MGEDNEPRFRLGLFIAIVLLVIAIVAFGFFTYKFINQNKTSREKFQATTENRLTSVPTEEPSATPEATVTPGATITPEPTEEVTEADDMLPNNNLQSDFACMIRASDGAILLNKNAEEKMYPASMSKIMTCIIALEKLTDLNATVTVYQEQIDPGYEQEASMAGFAANEQVRVLDLLFGVMLPSGADACEALVAAVAGTDEAFVELMNQKAAEIGMKNTHFANATGLHSDDHYTTCYDMCLLMEYAMKNSDFRNIIATPSFTTIATEQHPQGILLTSTVYQGMSTLTFPNGAVFEGGKTGTTEQALKCLASAAAFYGEEYFLVTGHASGDGNGNFEDAVTAYSELTH